MCISITAQAGSFILDEVTASSKAAGIAVVFPNRPRIKPIGLWTSSSYSEKERDLNTFS